MAEDESLDKNIFIGNSDNLEQFKRNFPSVHDRTTIDFRYRVAKKKESMLIFRRHQGDLRQIQLLVVPYSLAKEKGGIRAALKSRMFPNIGYVRTINIDTNELYVFGEMIPKNESQTVFDKIKKHRKEGVV